MMASFLSHHQHRTQVEIVKADQEVRKTSMDLEQIKEAQKTNADKMQKLTTELQAAQQTAASFRKSLPLVQKSQARASEKLKGLNETAHRVAKELEKENRLKNYLEELREEEEAGERKLGKYLNEVLRRDAEGYDGDSGSESGWSDLGESVNSLKARRQSASHTDSPSTSAHPSPDAPTASTPPTPSPETFDIPDIDNLTISVDAQLGATALEPLAEAPVTPPTAAMNPPETLRSPPVPEKDIVPQKSIASLEEQQSSVMADESIPATVRPSEPISSVEGDKEAEAPTTYPSDVIDTAAEGHDEEPSDGITTNANEDGAQDADDESDAEEPNMKEESTMSASISEQESAIVTQAGSVALSRASSRAVSPSPNLDVASPSPSSSNTSSPSPSPSPVLSTIQMILPVVAPLSLPSATSPRRSIPPQHRLPPTSPPPYPLPIPHKVRPGDYYSPSGNAYEHERKSVTTSPRDANSTRKYMYPPHPLSPASTVDSSRRTSVPSADPFGTLPRTDQRTYGSPPSSSSSNFASFSAQYAASNPIPSHAAVSTTTLQAPSPSRAKTYSSRGDLYPPLIGSNPGVEHTAPRSSRALPYAPAQNGTSSIPASRFYKGESKKPVLPPDWATYRDNLNGLGLYGARNEVSVHPRSTGACSPASRPLPASPESRRHYPSVSADGAFIP